MPPELKHNLVQRISLRTDSMENPPSPSEPTIFPAWFSRSPAARALAGCFGAAITFAIRSTTVSRPFSSGIRPVISIGGIRAGGTGKTPVALLVGEYLMSKEFAVAFLSRGYARKDTRLRVVKPLEKVFWELSATTLAAAQPAAQLLARHPPNGAKSARRTRRFASRTRGICS